jgi:uncharacterized protein YutD
MYHYYDNNSYNNDIYLGGFMLLSNNNYEIIKNEKDAIDEEVLKEAVTDYYDSFDYIVGDWAYGKLRLKGFYNSKNKKSSENNNIDNVDIYIKNDCAYGCKYFILKKVEK